MRTGYSFPEKYSPNAKGTPHNDDENDRRVEQDRREATQERRRNVESTRQDPDNLACDKPWSRGYRRKGWYGGERRWHFPRRFGDASLVKQARRIGRLTILGTWNLIALVLCIAFFVHLFSGLGLIAGILVFIFFVPALGELMGGLFIEDISKNRYITPVNRGRLSE